MNYFWFNSYVQQTRLFFMKAYKHQGPVKECIIQTRVFSFGKKFSNPSFFSVRNSQSLQQNFTRKNLLKENSNGMFRGASLIFFFFKNFSKKILPSKLHVGQKWNPDHDQETVISRHHGGQIKSMKPFEYHSGMVLRGLTGASNRPPPCQETLEIPPGRNTPHSHAPLFNCF